MEVNAAAARDDHVVVALRRIGVILGFLFGFALLAAATAAEANAEEDGLIESVVEAAEPVAVPVVDAVRPVADAAKPVVAPAAAALRPVVEPVEATLEPVVEPVTATLEPVAATLEPVLEVASPLVEPVLSTEKPAKRTPTPRLDEPTPRAPQAREVVLIEPQAALPVARTWPTPAPPPSAGTDPNTTGPSNGQGAPRPWTDPGPLGAMTAPTGSGAHADNAVSAISPNAEYRPVLYRTSPNARAPAPRHGYEDPNHPS